MRGKRNRKRPAPYRKPPPADARFISAPQLLNRYGGRSHMWLVRKLADDPNFPRPRYFGRLRFFEISELETYERAAATARPAEVAS
jgi:hypothetical protein